MAYGGYMELLKELEKLEIKLEEEANEKNEQFKIIDIKYYKHITFDKVKGEKEPLYLIEKEVDGKIVKQLQAGDKVIADIAQDNTIILREDVKDKSTIILMHLNNITPTSLRELQEREKLHKLEQKQEQKTQNKKENKENKKQEEQKENNNQNPYSIAEIDLDKPIVGKKNFRDLVPEIKEKEVEKVKVRRTGLGTDNGFEFYGIGKNGEYIKLETLKRTEATNQTKEVNEIKDKGQNSKVEKNRVSAMFSLTNGTNEGHGNEGFTIDLSDGTGTPEVAYYRRARNYDENIKDSTRYESIPVSMKDTNQKRTTREARQHMEKSRNTDISDNIQKSNEILEEQDETTLENIDDSPYNDNIETMEEYVGALIEEAAKECKVSVEGFKKIMEFVKSSNDTIKEQIEKTKDEIYKQMPGRRILG
jgi:hypothetical protein